MPINSAISAVVNYNWCNRLNPGEYFVHDSAAGVHTLHSCYWDPSSEYSSSGDAIGFFVAGVALGVIGIVATVVTGGAVITGLA
jgi:hypothetical protein